MMYERVAAAFYGTPWAMERGKFDVIRSVLARKQAGERFSEIEIKAASAECRPAVATSGRGGTAVLCCFGTISQRMSALEESSGGCSCEELSRDLDRAAADQSVSLIVIVFDSPGGSVYGIDELGRKIASIRVSQKHHRHRRQHRGVRGLLASVAMFRGLCDRRWERRVASASCLRTRTIRTAKEGRESKRLSSAAARTRPKGHPFGPLDADARAEIQSKCDHYYGMFVAAVARGRGVSEGKVKNSFGGGRMLTAQQAVAVGAADRIATLQQVLSDAAGGRAGRQGREGGSGRSGGGAASAIGSVLPGERGRGRIVHARPGVAVVVVAFWPNVCGRRLGTLPTNRANVA